MGDLLLRRKPPVSQQFGYQPGECIKDFKIASDFRWLDEFLRRSFEAGWWPETLIVCNFKKYAYFLGKTNPKSMIGDASRVALEDCMRDERITRSEQIRRVLTSEILAGDRIAGSPLDEQELAAAFGVSRTPVREALRLLAASGLVDHRPNRGATVAAPSASDLRDLFQVMADLEGLCASHAARAMSPDERRALAAAHKGMAPIVRQGDRAAYAKANENFHALIYAGSHNQFLAGITMQTRARLRPYRRAQFSTLGRLSASHAEHELIIRVILQGDRMAAQKLMSEHILVVRDAALRLAEGDGKGQAGGLT